MIKVETADSNGQSIEIERKYSKSILTIQNIIDEGFDENEPIQIPLVSRKAFKKVYEFCKYIYEKEPLIIVAPINTPYLNEII